MSTESAYVNPFPSSAVARLSPLAGDCGPVTIKTQALRDGLEQISDYLNRTEPDRAGNRDGCTIAIIGEYGTGKTYLAYNLLQTVASSSRKNIHTFYLDAPADTFLALYRQRFFPLLKLDDVRARIEEYYADILAEQLESSDMTRGLATDLRARKANPSELVSHYGFTESVLVRRLASRLKKITERSDFGTAMLLLRRPEFEFAVWEWLSGQPPDKSLVERGVTRTIEDDATALEAIAVIAHVFGQQQHRFVLAIDEVEKLAASLTVSEASVLAFKKLMESIGKTGALLILSGLPDFLESLPADAVQRISRILKPSPLAGTDVQEYIRTVLQKAQKGDTLHPFSPDTASYIAEIAGGNARKIIRLCYYAFEQAHLSKAEVSRAAIREVARTQFELVSSEDVANEILNVINSNGWIVERQKTIGKKKGAPKADFWLPVGDGGEACAVILTSSLLHEHDVKPLVERAVAFRESDQAGPKVMVLLVVNGYLADTLTNSLIKAFDDFIVYRVRLFAESLHAALSGWRHRLELRSRENALGIIKERIDQVIRQNSTIRESLEERERSGQTRREIQTAMASTLRSFFGQLSAGSGTSVDDPQVIELFRRLTPNFDEVVTSYRSKISQAYLHVRRGQVFQVEEELRLLTDLGVAEIFLIEAIIREFRGAVSIIIGDLKIPRMAPQDEVLDLCKLTDRLMNNVLVDRLLTTLKSHEAPLVSGFDVETVSRELRRLGEYVFKHFDEQREPKLR